MYINGTWESSVLEKVECMVHMQDAIATYLQSESPPTVLIGRSIAVPRYDPIVDNLHAHPAFFGRTANNLTLADVAYRAVAGSGGVEGTYYAQVITMGKLHTEDGEQHFVFCKGYEKVSSPQLNPLGMQPLIWEATPKPEAHISKKSRKVNTVPGHFFILDAQALQRQVCIVPNFKLGDGHFFINPLVHEAEAHLVGMRGGAKSS
jgi:hypothetical protein